MSKMKMILMMSFVCVFSISLQAQYIIEQVEYTIPYEDDLFQENIGLDGVEDVDLFFLQLSESKLKDAAQKAFGDIEKIESTIYIDGDNLAVESHSQDLGKTTIIINQSKGMIYYIIWAQKKIYEMSNDELVNKKKDPDAAMQQMIAQFPLEMQEQVKMAMKIGQGRKQATKKVKSTGREMIKCGQKCTEYLVEEDFELMVIWASGDNIDLVEKAKRMTDKLDDIFPSMGEDDQDGWDLVAGKMPLEVRNFYVDGMEVSKMEIQEITRITKTKPPVGKFIFPSEAAGFDRSPFNKMIMQQMMMDQMMPGEEEE